MTSEPILEASDVTKTFTLHAQGGVKLEISAAELVVAGRSVSARLVQLV